MHHGYIYIYIYIYIYVWGLYVIWCMHMKLYINFHYVICTPIICLYAHMSTGCFPDQALALPSSTCSLLSCLPQQARFSGACRCGSCTSSRCHSQWLLERSWCGAHGPGDSFSDRQGWSNMQKYVHHSTTM